MEVSGQCDATAALPPGHNPINHLIGGWVGPRTVMDSLENWKSLPPIEIWIPDHPVHSPVSIQIKLSQQLLLHCTDFLYDYLVTGYLEIFTHQMHINNIFQYISVLIPVFLPLQVDLVVLSYPALSNGSVGQFLSLCRSISMTSSSRLVGQVLSQSIFYSAMWCCVVWQEFTNILKDPAASIFRLCSHHILKDSIPHSHHHKNFWSHSLSTLGKGTEFLYGSLVQMGHRFPSTGHVNRPLWITNGGQRVSMWSQRYTSCW